MTRKSLKKEYRSYLKILLKISLKDLSILSILHLNCNLITVNSAKEGLNEE